MKIKIFTTLISFMFSVGVLNLSAQINLNQGLAAYWNFNGNANDLSGNNNNGTVYGATLTNDNWGNPNGAYYFNGINNWIEVPNSPTLNFNSNSFTVYALINVQGYYSGTCHGNSIIDRGAADNNPGAFHVRFADGYYTNGANCVIPLPDTLHENFIAGCTNAFAPSIIPPQYIQNNVWYCVIAINDGSNLKVYVNGVLNYDGQLNGLFTVSSESIFIGKHNSVANPYWLKGIIDELRLYNRALNMQEVQALCSCSVMQNNFNALLNNDTTICSPTSIPLITSNMIDTNSIFWWSPAVSLSDSTSLNPIANPILTTEYFFNQLYPGCNMIYNADFESGNVGFTSQYIYAPVNAAGGEYFVGPNTLAWNPWLGSFGDHTTGSGNMLMVNGSPNPNTSVWCETVNTVPNTDYVFSAWIQNINIWGQASNPATLQFSVNGNLLGTPFTTTINAGIWQQFYQTWNSGPNTSATICLVDQNTVLSGNDFAIDDILFAPGILIKDSVTITIGGPTVSASPNVGVCNGQSTQLNATGAINYVWTPATGLSNPNIANPVCNIISTTIYTVTGTDAAGCSSTSSVTVTISPGINITIVPQQPILCIGDSIALTAAGALSYDWINVPGLNTYVGSSVWASPVVATTYTVTGTDAGGCTGTATVFVTIATDIFVEATKSGDIECNNHTVQLTATGAENYSWSPANLLSNPYIANPTATVYDTTTFYVTGMLGSCIASDSITVLAFNNDEGSIFIPSAFSPNGDNLNDCLKIKQGAKFKSYYFTIYNRWGQQVFETDSPDMCWNGQVNGRECEVGVYFFYLKAETNCGQIFKKGDITLIK